MIIPITPPISEYADYPLIEITIDEEHGWRNDTLTGVWGRHYKGFLVNLITTFNSNLYIDGVFEKAGVYLLQVIDDGFYDDTYTYKIIAIDGNSVNDPVWHDTHEIYGDDQEDYDEFIADLKIEKEE